ncbi:MAG: CDGSH iron-sulfur domain-containing protein, partial [Halioglobus sp.]
MDGFTCSLATPCSANCQAMYCWPIRCRIRVTRFSQWSKLLLPANDAIQTLAGINPRYAIRQALREPAMDQPKRAADTPFGVDVEAGKAYFWCACGLSASQPFCDGSH